MIFVYGFSDFATGIEYGKKLYEHNWEWTYFINVLKLSLLPVTLNVEFMCGILKTEHICVYTLTGLIH